MSERLPSESRRQSLRLLTALAASGLGAALAQAPARVREIAVTAKRFEFVPADIELKAGEEVVVVVTSLDFVHGMNIPDLKRRYDLVPGRPTRIPLLPKQAGVIEFVCDNFCGDGHEEMHGRFVVRS